MPRYYCDYCDTYLTHDSPSVRKQHNAGYKHKANVRSYYQQFEEQQTQSLIDQKVKEHLVGQTAYQHQVGVAFNQHLVSLPSALPRPRLPVLPTSFMPIGASPQTPANVPLMPGVRAPVLPRPAPGPPGYAAVPTFPSVVMPPGASPVSMQPNGMPRPPAMPGAPSIASNGSLLSNNPGGYLGNPTATVSASSGTPPASLSQASAATSLPSHVYAASPQPQGLQMMSPGRVGQSTASSSSQDGYSYGQASDASHSTPAY